MSELAQDLGIGSVYTSWLFGNRLRHAGLLGFMGSIGDAYDNSVAEAFFSSLQRELLVQQTWHNPRRRHSYNGSSAPSITRPPRRRCHPNPNCPSDRANSMSHETIGVLSSLCEVSWRGPRLRTCQNRRRVAWRRSSSLPQSFPAHIAHLRTIRSRRMLTAPSAIVGRMRAKAVLTASVLAVALLGCGGKEGASTEGVEADSGTEVELAVSAKVMDDTILIEGTATVPDGAFVFYGLEPEACAADSLGPECSAGGALEVHDGRFTGRAVVSAFPPGQVDVWVVFRVVGNEQPSFVVETYGELGQNIVGPKVEETGPLRSVRALATVAFDTSR